MNQRPDESRGAFRKRRWRATQRTVGGDGATRSVVLKREGRNPENRVQVENAVPFRTSTLYDADGNVSAQWVMERPEEKARLELWRTMALGLAAALPRAEPSPAPEASNEGLMVGYPIGDHHMGMLSWKHETGTSYDLDIGERLLVNAFGALTQAVPAAHHAMIVVLGDFFHYDSLEPKTPTSGNILDADGRYPKMVMAGLRTIRSAISSALVRHSFVRVIVEIGNHDLSTAIFLAVALQAVYENEPRVSVDVSPRHFHYYTWGSVLIGTHHGHGPKPEQLPLIMATDCPEEWARCSYRYWWTGHVHSKRAWDYPGCHVESFRILPPGDAWAVNKGYRSHQSMEAIVYHQTHGEVARHTVNPRMLG